MQWCLRPPLPPGGHSLRGYRRGSHQEVGGSCLTDISTVSWCSFQKSGGTGCYPPPSLHSLITIFLGEAPASAKLRLVQYFFLDLAHLLPQDQFPDLVDSLIKFPSAFSLPPSVIKLTQAFWLLDHEDWEDR